MSTGGREERKNGDTPALMNFLDQFTQNTVSSLIEIL